MGSSVRSGFRREFLRNRLRLRVFLGIYLLLALWAGRTAGKVFWNEQHGYTFGSAYGSPRHPNPLLDYVSMMTISVILLAGVEYRRMKRRGAQVVLAFADARPLSDRRAGHVTQEMAIAAGLPAPKLWIVEDAVPNAFACGSDPARSSIAVTRGLLDLLDRDELQAVVAHEVAHIRNGDTMLLTVLLGLGRAFHLLSSLVIGPLKWIYSQRHDEMKVRTQHAAKDLTGKQFLLLVLALPLLVALLLGGSLVVTVAFMAFFSAVIVALPWLIAAYALFDLFCGAWLDRRRRARPPGKKGPWWRFLYLAPVGLVTGPAILVLGILLPAAHFMLRLAVSRNREFQADATAVDLTRNPGALLSALRKLADAPRGGALKKRLSPLTIVPVGESVWDTLGIAVFSTHPPLSERIRRVARMTPEPGYASVAGS